MDIEAYFSLVARGLGNEQLEFLDGDVATNTPKKERWPLIDLFDEPELAKVVFLPGRRQAHAIIATTKEGKRYITNPRLLVPFDAVDTLRYNFFLQCPLANPVVANRCKSEVNEFLLQEKEGGSRGVENEKIEKAQEAYKVLRLVFPKLVCDRVIAFYFLEYVVDVGFAKDVVVENKARVPVELKELMVEDKSFIVSIPLLGFDLFDGRSVPAEGTKIWSESASVQCMVIFDVFKSDESDRTERSQAAEEKETNEDKIVFPGWSASRGFDYAGKVRQFEVCRSPDYDTVASGITEFNIQWAHNLYISNVGKAVVVRVDSSSKARNFNIEYFELRWNGGGWLTKRFHFTEPQRFYVLPVSFNASRFDSVGLFIKGTKDAEEVLEISVFWDHYNILVQFDDSFGLLYN